MTELRKAILIGGPADGDIYMLETSRRELVIPVKVKPHVGSHRSAATGPESVAGFYRSALYIRSVLSTPLATRVRIYEFSHYA